MARIDSQRRFREAEIWRRETMAKAANSEGLHEGWWRKRDEIWRQREDELEREKWRKRDEKAAETWRRVNEESGSRGER